MTPQVPMTREAVLATALQAHGRIAIVGGPRSGKTTLAQLVIDRPVIHTDMFRHLPWGDVPGTIIRACAVQPRFVVEGVQIARALRAGLQVDAIIYLDDPKAELTKGQMAMQKAIATVFNEWRACHREVRVVSPDIAPGENAAGEIAAGEIATGETP